jgi:PAS domain S-box-containing protein
MRVQTKLILSIFPIVLAGFIVLSILSFNTAKDMIRSNVSRYIDNVLDTRCNQTLLRRSELLRTSKMDKVTSFLSLYQQEALAELMVGSDSKFGCFVVFNRKGEFLFSSSDCATEPLLSQFRLSALKAVAEPARQNRGQISNGARRVFGARYFEPWNWVLVYSTEMSGFENAINQILTITILLSGLCVTLCALVIIIVFRRVFGLPVIRLKTAAARIANREPNVVIEIDSRDELGELSVSLNEMAAAISGYISKLELLTCDLEKSNEAMKIEIADRQKAQTELKDAHDKLAATIQAIPDLMFEVDSNGQIYDHHAPQLQDLFVDPARFSGQTINELLPGDPAKAIMTAIGQAALHGRHRGTIYALDLPSGRRWFELSIAAKGAMDGQKTRFVAIAHEITERKLAEEEKAKLESQLHQAQKMESIGRLAGGVAHDFNNMLSAILGHTELALELCAPTEPIHRHLTVIEDSAQRSADLTRQLLAFARKQTVSPKIIDLNDSVSGMLKMLMRLIGEDIKLVWMPGPALWQLRIDPSQIDQIFANLCVNARDAINGVGTVTIATENIVYDESFCAAHPGYSCGEYVLLAVSDTGCGMSKEVLDRLFEPFFTTKEMGKGTGLGLATVYGIVKQNEGFVIVDSAPGKGSTFRIHLPRVAGKIVQPATDSPTELPRGQGEMVLVVEDEDVILDASRIMLERLGYTVLIAGTPVEAIRQAIAHTSELRLLITDVVMPEMNGRDMAQKIGAITPGLKFLFISGYTADVIAHHGVLDEGLNFLQKPFSMTNLAFKVRSVLDKA